ncbi:ATP-grasp domain-containing protein [Corynebacterium felinum]|uniref:ATP-grasp domain-containing protein n=1 Tax=Corynebacterium felinum TaxID=131318 RepID=A0ABU2B739_9CORY|nr:ATP-grasp domain-containing protein [Corynebacterium felinum]MDF5820356.1 ATP-grasp domain-containing protein [Corynebacterium felinum]MDR7354428.1 hypothetical protein [Corynebacterium felinum]WJY93798.1 carbamoyl phosphate synthase-like protein [Corynebacterium felinum]
MNILLCKYDISDEMPLWFVDYADEVHLVLDEFDKSRDLPSEVLSNMTSIHYVTSFDSFESVTGVVAEIKETNIHIDVVASFTEFSQIGAAYIAQLLGVKHQSVAVAAATRDKRLMKMRARSSGIPCARFLSIPTRENVDSLRDLSRLTFPVVIKPAAGMSTMSTEIAGNEAKAREIIMGLDIPPQFGSKQIIVEEFIEGDEFLVDAIWDNGECVHFSIAKYMSPRLRANEPKGINGCFIVREDENYNFYRQVRDFHDRINKAFEVMDGATHLEFFQLRDGSLVFSELATRLGGGGSPPMIRGSLGFDIRELWAAQQAKAIEKMSPSRESIFPAVGFFNLEPSHPGFIKSVPDIDSIRNEQGILEARLMTEVGRFHSREHPSEWGIFLVIGGKTSDELVDKFLEISENYPIETSSP